MKCLITKAGPNDFKSAMLEYRNTPRIDGLSPAQWYLGRRQRTSAVAAPKAYERINNDALEECFKKHEQSYAKVKEKGPKKKINNEQFTPGTKVIVQDQKSKRQTQHAVIINQRSERTFILDDGTQRFKKNRQFFVIDPEQETETIDLEQETETESRPQCSTKMPHLPWLHSKRKKAKPKRLIETLS